MQKLNTSLENSEYMGGFLSGYLKRTRLKQAASFINPNSGVLDLGCFVGDLLEYLPPSVRYVGLDISEPAINQARSNYPQHVFHVADLTEVGLADIGKFDAVVMLAFLEHIKDPGALLRSYAEVLNPQGLIIVTTPVPYGRRFHDIGSQMGLFSKLAAEEHETFISRILLEQFAAESNLSLEVYKKFLFGFNQLACYRKRTNSR